MTAIESLHRYIIDNQTWDNDFWDFGGNDRLCSMLSLLTINEWHELKQQLSTWTSNELLILGDALVQLHLRIKNLDIGDLYMRVFNLVEDSEADYLIQNLNIVDDGQVKSIELLQETRQRITKLQIYTSILHTVHDYESYYNLVDRLIMKNRGRQNYRAFN
jgi:hypothetical protein